MADKKRRALVVNCSAPHYNLGAHKLADWLEGEGYEVERCAGDPQMFIVGYDLICLSVIFSWHAPLARDIALRAKGHAEIWCGGCGMTELVDWWLQETGLRAHKGLDQRFEKQRGDYKMAFFSRGCPVGCSFCIVPIIEGVEFSYDYEFTPAPILCDNNLSALPAEAQEFIIRRYQETGTKLLDANSGFEPHTFTEETYLRWKPLIKTWRFAFDVLGERRAVERMMRILKDVSAGRKRVYVLIGNEPIEACRERAEKVIAWGGEPFCQPVLPLDWLREPRREDLPAAHDWTSQSLRDFARYYNRWLWRSLELREYKPRQSEPPPFASYSPRAA